MKKLLMLAVATAICVNAYAELRPNNPFSDGMVLQQMSEAPIWGTAEAGAVVKVTTSWDRKTYKCKAGDDGKWTVKVNTPVAAYDKHSIRVTSGKESVLINDVLIGEVWFASGQSNMEMPLKGYYNNPVNGYMDVITSPSERDKVRMFSAEIIGKDKPQDDAQGSWRGADASNRPGMSATAYFFAHRLNQVLDVPVGIITAAFGGTRLEAWMPKDMVERFRDEPTEESVVRATEAWARPYFCYNAMQHPFQGYAIRGFIWYQGCSNVGKHHQLVERMGLLINQWRNDWGDYDNELPFYMVELAPYDYGFDEGFQGGALFRQAQNECSKVIPNCGVAHINDIVEPWERHVIHPSHKQEGGDRLAYLALRRDYGLEGVECYCPDVEDYWVDGTRIYIKMSNAPQGFNRSEGVEGLEVAAEDGVFMPVTNISGGWESGCLEIECSGIAGTPKRVRYGWGDFKPGNLKNNFGLPVIPFEIWL